MIAAILNPNNIPCTFPIGGGIAAMVVAGLIGAPVLVGGAVAALTAAVSLIATRIFTNILNIRGQGPEMVISAAAIHIVCSILMGGALAFLSASIAFGTAVFLAFVGTAIVFSILVTMMHFGRQ